MANREPDLYAEARFALARLSVFEGTPLSPFFRHVAEMSARTLKVERVGVWLFERGGRVLRCVEQYWRSTGTHGTSPPIDAVTIPKYVAALERHREIVADDARTDPLTRELTDSYLVPLGITSMLDAPIFKAGDIIGVLCHEHVGPARVWTREESAFAGYAATAVELAFEQSARLRCEGVIRQRDAELAQARTLEALGIFAAQVAHDFNNVLAVAGAAADLLAVRPELAATASKDVHDAVERGRGLVRQLLDVVRPIQPSTAAIDVARAVEEMLPFLGAAVGSSVKIEWNVAANAGRACMARSDLERVLLNLVVNARDASPNGGVIALSVRREVGHVGITVRDEGIGMDEATRSRAFDPFFTTKGHAGSGLGLFTVKGLVERAGGTIDVESEPGKGSAFTVRLPVARA